MQISIPKIVKRLELKGYAEEFGEAFLVVWVNPPVTLLERLKAAKQRIWQMEIPKRELTPEEKTTIETEINESFDEQLAVYSEMLSQGREETRIDVADLRRMVEERVATDPNFWAWVQNEIAGLVNEHRGTAKKG